ISAVLLCLFAAAAYLLVRNAIIGQVNDLNRESKAFAALATKPIGDAYTIYKDSGTLRVKLEVQKFTDLDTNISGVQIIGPDGSELFPQAGDQLSGINAETVSNFDPAYKVNSNNFITQAVQPYFNDANQHPFSIVYTVSDHELAQNILRQETDILIFSIIGLLVSGAVVFELISRFFVLPVERMSRTAMAIRAGDYSKQIKATRNDEIGDLARSVNQMAEHLEGDIQKLQDVDKLKNEFIMIASHNLRTPLTIINGNVDIMKMSELDASIRGMVEAIETSAQNLGAFAEDMLTIASIEAGGIVLTPKPTTVGRLFKGLDKEFETQATDRHVTISWNIENPDQPLNASEIHLRGALRNLIDNALKFTKENGRIGVTVHHGDHETVIAVSDTGIGIAQAELPKLFTKFHRGTSTLEYNYSGTGIGLYAAKLVVQAHGGTITADSTEGKGSTFTIHLPDQPFA
ncbi:MAG TPA: HAMP domain-containing sensor histidine kinase, partial [Chroococcales cyanobacterium]